MKKSEYLDKYVFYGLKNINMGFDAEGIKYFSEAEFKIVLERVKQLGIGIMGIEPWENGEFYGVQVYEDFGMSHYDPNWYYAAFEMFVQKNISLQYSATYDVPKRLLLIASLKSFFQPKSN